MLVVKSTFKGVSARSYSGQDSLIILRSKDQSNAQSIFQVIFFYLLWVLQCFILTEQFCDVRSEDYFDVFIHSFDIAHIGSIFYCRAQARPVFVGISS